MSEAICKGSWEIGNNCGRCKQCVENAPDGVATISRLQSELARFRRRQARDESGLPPNRPVEQVAADIEAVCDELRDLSFEAGLLRLIVDVEVHQSTNYPPELKVSRPRFSQVIRP